MKKRLLFALPIALMALTSCSDTGDSNATKVSTETPSPTTVSADDSRPTVTELANALTGSEGMFGQPTNADEASCAAAHLESSDLTDETLNKLVQTGGDDFGSWEGSMDKADAALLENEDFLVELAMCFDGFDEFDSLGERQ